MEDPDRDIGASDSKRNVKGANISQNVGAQDIETSDKSAKKNIYIYSGLGSQQKRLRKATT